MIIEIKVNIQKEKFMKKNYKEENKINIIKKTIQKLINVFIL